MGVEESRPEEVELVRFTGMKVAGMGQSEGREKADGNANRKREQAEASEEGLECFHELDGADDASSNGHAKRERKTTMPSAKAWFCGMTRSNNRDCKLFEGALEEGLAYDVLVFLEDLELAVGLGLADVDVLGEVVVLLGGDLAAGAVE